MVDDPERTPRATGGRAPDVFTPGGWVPMREYREDEEVDFVIVGTGAGGGTLACKLAEAGFSGGGASLHLPEPTCLGILGLAAAAGGLRRGGRRHRLAI